MKNAINIEYPPLPQKYVSHNVQITSGVPSRSEDKIKANSSELDTQHKGAIPSSKSIHEALQDHSHSRRTDIPQTDNLTHRENSQYVPFQILPSPQQPLNVGYQQMPQHLVPQYIMPSSLNPYQKPSSLNPFQIQPQPPMMYYNGGQVAVKV